MVSGERNITITTLPCAVSLLLLWHAADEATCAWIENRPVWINNKQKRTINNPYKRCVVYFVSLDTAVFFFKAK